MSRPIVHVIENLAGAHGGSTSAAFAIANASINSGCRTIIVGIDYGGEITTTLAPEVSLVRIPSRPTVFGRSAALFRFLGWIIRHRNLIEIVEFHNVFTPLFLMGSLVSTFCGISIILNPHNSLDADDLKKRKNLKRLIGHLYLGYLLTCCSAVRCATRREWRRLVSYGRRIHKSWALLPIQVDSPYSPQRPRADDVLRILFCSRIDRKKHVEILLAACSRAKAQGLKFQLTIAGSGDTVYASELNQLSGQLGVAADVVWAGFVAGDAKRDLFFGADIFVLPSKYENFGIVVVEALCHGLRPVLTSNVFIADHLPHDCSAVIADTEEELTNALLDASTHPDRYRVSRETANMMKTFLLGPQGAGHIINLYHACIRRKKAVII